MSLWNAVLLGSVFFLFSVFYSFKKEPSVFRSFMRFFAVAVIVVASYYGYVFKGLMDQSRNCNDKTESFYESNEDLCYSVVNIKEVVNKNARLEINKFIIINDKVAIFNTPLNEQYEIKYLDGVGLKTRLLN